MFLYFMVARRIGKGRALAVNFALAAERRINGARAFGVFRGDLF